MSCFMFISLGAGDGETKQKHRPTDLFTTEQKCCVHHPITNNHNQSSSCAVAYGIPAVGRERLLRAPDIVK